MVKVKVSPPSVVVKRGIEGGTLFPTT
jgi:hypothetical protein